MKKSESSGGGILEAEVLNISHHGFWLMVSGKEYFLDYDVFPWFRQGTVDQLCSVELWHGHHLYWPKLDVELDLDRITHPEKYPLIAKPEAEG